MTSFESLQSEFLHTCEFTKRLDSKTLRAYRIDLKQFQAYLNRTNACFTEKETLNGYLETLHIRYAPATVKRKIATLKAFFHYLARKDYADNPFHKLDVSFREPQRLPRYVPLHCMQDLIALLYKKYNQADTTPKRKEILRDIAVLELLFSTGIRISELCLLPASSIDLPAREMKIFGKGAKERLLQLDRRAVQSLTRYRNAYAKEIDREGYFFIGSRGGHLSDQAVRYMINKYTEQLPYKIHITPHMFRHTFAKSLLEQDVDIRIIQPILGHSSIKTTERYTFVSSSKQKEVLQKKNPLSLLRAEKLP